MTYVVTWKRQANGEVLNEEEFEDMRDALTDAMIYMPNSFPIEITITDREGNEHYRSVTPIPDDN